MQIPSTPTGCLLVLSEDGLHSISREGPFLVVRERGHMESGGLDIWDDEPVMRFDLRDGSQADDLLSMVYQFRVEEEEVEAPQGEEYGHGQ